MSDSRAYPDRPIVGVGVVVFKDDAVLLIQRGKPPRYGEWTIPGGVIELGETVRDAARREIREECGIEIALGDVIDVADIFSRDEIQRLQYHYVVVEIAAVYASGALRAGSDVLDARWVAADELARIDLKADTRHVILNARREKS
ncbi:MAG: NUDIX hydrolase [Chloroflexi bacterium]|nr:NUDIX hydrolase [Chloroflexota bacterium]MBI3741535.1 NUDIX hydrolase [Chloroflexota bacterium]